MSTFRAYSFGEYVLDLRRGALTRDGAEVRLRPKSFEVLRYLVERHGQLISKEALLNGVWGRSVVTDASITQCLIEVRRAIGDESQTAIRTIQRRGYVFDVPVSESDVSASSPTLEAPSPPISDVPGSTRPGIRRGVGIRIGVLAAALVLALAWAWLWTHGSATRQVPSAAAPTEPSIAVLPFADLSPDKDQQYLADGIAEEILDRLAGSASMRVIARTSAFSFRNQPIDVPTIAAKLQVGHILEGSVRRSGNRIRVTAQLVDVATDSHVWSKTYDRELGDLFAVQDEIARSVAGALETSLVGPPIHGSPPATGAAYERYLQGQFFFKRRSPGDIERAAKYFQESVALDPNFALGWAALSGAYRLLSWEVDHTSDWRTRQGEAATRSVELDPLLPDGHLRLAQFYFESGRLENAASEFRRASDLSPGEFSLMSLSAGYPQWRDEDLLAVLKDDRRLVARDPLSPSARKNLGLALFATGHLDEALVEFRRALELNPDLGADVELEIGRVLVAQGRYPEARAQWARLPEGELRDAGVALLFDSPDDRQDSEAALARLVDGSGDYMRDLRIAEAWAMRRRDNEAFKWLQRARDGLETGPELAARVWWLQVEIFQSPFLMRLHADPRWADLMAAPG